MNSSRIYFGAKPSWSGKRFSQNIPLLLQPLTIQERILWNTKYQAVFNLRGFISLQVIYLFVKTLSEKNIYIFIAYVAKFATHRTYGGKIYLHQYHHDHYQFWNLRETKFLSTTLKTNRGEGVRPIMTNVIVFFGNPSLYFGKENTFIAFKINFEKEGKF